jgi:hypothetical protein
MAAVRSNERSGASVIEVSQQTGDPPLVIPAGTHYLGEDGAIIVAPKNGDPTINTIQIQDGAVLRNLWLPTGPLVLEFNNSSPNAWVNDPIEVTQPPVYRVGVNAVVVAAGTAPIVQTHDSGLAVIALAGGSFRSDSGQPFIMCGTTAAAFGFTLLVVFDQINPSQPLDPAMVQTPALAVGTALILEHDGGIAFPFAMPSFAGAIINAPFGTCGGSGASSFRPIAPFGPPSQLSTGCMFFETSGASHPPPFPIWYDGAGGWVDATGTPVP